MLACRPPFAVSFAILIAILLHCLNSYQSPCSFMIQGDTVGGGGGSMGIETGKQRSIFGQIYLCTVSNMVTTDGNISPEEASAFNVILYCDIAISVWPQILDWLGLRLIFPHNVLFMLNYFVGIPGTMILRDCSKRPYLKHHSVRAPIVRLIMAVLCCGVASSYRFCAPGSLNFKGLPFSMKWVVLIK
ncbi:hypothetical protein P8452_09595 [Trifolium repens]|nr:hypothetical protein P8452_09595 [Trifolium repens]